MAPHPPFTVRPAKPGERVYRVVGSDTPTSADFFSDEEAGLHRNLPVTQNMAIYRGFSVKATLPQAQSLARRLGKSHVAEVELSPDEADAIARTLKSTGHHTVWASPALVARRIVQVHPV